MDVAQRDADTEQPQTDAELNELLQPGVLVVKGGRSGTLAFADARALSLLGCADRAALETLWSTLGGRIEEAEPAGRRLAFDWHGEREGGGMNGDGVLLVHDAAVGESLTADLRQATLLRSLAQITPAVAHDLRAPINAMVFNIEVLKETIAAGKGAEPTGRERQLRYINVLREELHRLHQGLEAYIAQISPRGDRDETFDLREPVGELAALLVGPARKQQARIVPQVPESPVRVTGNRHLIRQALLHVAVAALGGVARDGALEIGLESRGGKARVRFASSGPATAPAAGAASPSGAQAQLWAARSILAGLGGEVRTPDSSGDGPAYEVELQSTQDSGSQEKE
ncbi:MAG TPA: histidine kinase dimerization/phospho-acceptor domain-containing protein [Thermoanaerobaculia bacterium]|jgi:signal transduction histidine kinase|nr:histidine kinase dimerization/phospho-acceptor domain-containing protein [Thermoanaerobaculia bacterium]